jgi:glutathione synthase/RimK-type ligase-like ATP-grasp enzyme
MSTIWVLTDKRYIQQRMPRALTEWLGERGVPFRTLIADEQVAQIPSPQGAGGSDPWSGLQPGDVVIARTRNPFALALLRAGPPAGVSVCNPWEAIAAVRDKARTAQVLAAHGIPTPPTFLADSPAALRALPVKCFPLLLKPHLGDNSSGILFVRESAELDDVPWGDAMVLAQQFIDAGGIDLKLYLANDQVWAVRKPSPLSTRSHQWSSEGGSFLEAHEWGSEQVGEVIGELRDLAFACSSAFGLELCGVDVLETSSGPVVVDVNDFPNYTGVPEAPQTIGTMLLERLGSTPARATQFEVPA